jgi:glycosyltransferase involved in cell wall biosynthesis
MSATGSVVIASANRPHILKETVRSVLEQTVQPQELVVSVPQEQDFPLVPDEFPARVKRVIAPTGLARQRNFGFRALTVKTDFVTFLDDDIILHRDYLYYLSQAFATRPHAVCIMGHLLANGNISLERAKELCHSPPKSPQNLQSDYYATSATWGHLYGANMSFAWHFLEQECFDERLPLYSEMEDTDMGTRARRRGEVGYYFACQGVHLQAASGRINYKKRGFSQIMNFYYLVRKGTIPAEGHKQHVVKKIAANAVLVLLPRQTRKRIGLPIGNLYAVRHILVGRIEPELILNLK